MSNTNNMTKVLVTGNTYPVKDALKALGATWDAQRKGWLVPASVAPKARALVASAGQRKAPQFSAPASRGRWTGCRCGSREGESRESDCAQCRYDNE